MGALSGADRKHIGWPVLLLNMPSARLTGSGGSVNCSSICPCHFPIRWVDDLDAQLPPGLAFAEEAGALGPWIINCFFVSQPPIFSE